ncbi:MAG: DNA-binding response regulator [Verrucomicrobia bacterium]|nr:MAG: DNA-binding response regulator [Verrucomicrobiota bacterium]TAE87962.1 MAG: DNA-binding response regulator [Verrucomicrobiota bacterium]TAF26186.1 MAG: DNA-binding response regulator [Verrucomicrobiota bacterium]TAF41741.1 MAG: DNA-binding response regulator [Verrucomicrobiota bacterium]
MKILLVEDEPQLAGQVSRALTKAGHHVEWIGDGPCALEATEREEFELVVLDVNLPGCDGFEVLAGIRRAKLPARVLMLTARSEVGDRVAGLQAGADDYLTKPFAMEELLARVDALGRRRGDAPTPPETLLQVGAIRMDLAKRRVTRGNERVELSPREFEVLAVFMQEPGRTFSRDEICERIWEREHEYDTRTVEIFIMRLRKKLDRPGAESVIGTVRGVGYLMQPSR